MPKLLIATKNHGKFLELSKPLEPFGFELISLGQFPDIQAPDEPHGTYEANAIEKAEYYLQKTQVEYVLADDSGIEIPVMQGALGVKTRRFGLGESASDADWLQHFLQAMSPFQGDPLRRARFVSVLCLKSQQQTLCFEGESEGIIAKEVLAPIVPGIPLSSVFVPNGHSKPYAGLTVEEKTQISHRGRALQKLIDYFLDNGFNYQ